MFFAFPDDARWNAERQAVGFGVEIGEYRGVVRVPRRVFQRLLSEQPTPERCVEAYYLQRTRFESIAERKLRRRQLTEDGNAEISGARFAQSTRPKLCPPARSVSNRPRPCENAQEPTMRRIVFFIAHFPIAATALFFFRLTKSRRTFYV